MKNNKKIEVKITRSCGATAKIAELSQEELKELINDLNWMMRKALLIEEFKRENEKKVETK